MKGRMNLRQKTPEYFPMKLILPESQGFVVQLLEAGRHFGKGNPGVWMCLCFCVLIIS